MRESVRVVAVFAFLSFAMAAVGRTQPTVTNPSDTTYDPKTGKFFGADGTETGAPPVPPFLKNRGWTQDPKTGKFIDPNGGNVDPSSFYPPPDVNPNPDGYTYDPGTKTFFGPEGAKPYVDLPPYLEGRGYRTDSSTGEILDPDGNLVDPSTLFPAPGRDPVLRYDPQTGKYYTAAGKESPPTPSREMQARGWRHDPNTGQWIDPSGKRFAPSQVFDPPSDPNPNGFSYDPQTGGYFDEDGNLISGELPEFMTNQGWTLNPNTGDITDPSGAKVDPAKMFPEPHPNPGGFTYDPGSKKFFGTGSMPDIPDYLKKRGWEMDVRTGELIDPDGNRHDPSTYFPAPSTDPGFLYDPATGKFYAPGGAEIPPTLPDTMREMGWKWDPVKKKFVDPKGNLVDPATLCPHPHPGPLPRGSTPSTSTNNSTSHASPGPTTGDQLSPGASLTSIERIQLAQKGLISVSPYDPSKPSTVLVHGAEGTRTNFYNLKNQFIGEGYNVFMFMYQPTMLVPPEEGVQDSTYDQYVKPYRGALNSFVADQADVQQASYEFADAMKMLQARTGADSFNILAHSLGGTLTRFALTKNNGGSSLADGGEDATEYKFFPYAVPFQGATALRSVPDLLIHMSPEVGFYGPIIDPDGPFLSTAGVGTNVEIFKLESNEEGFGSGSVLTDEGQRHPAIDSDPQLQWTKTVKGSHSFMKYTGPARNLVKEVNAVRDAPSSGNNADTSTGEPTPNDATASDVSESVSLADFDFWYGPPAPDPSMMPASSSFAAPGDFPLDLSALNMSGALGGSRDIRIQLEIVFVTRTRVADRGTTGELRATERSRESHRARWFRNVAALFTPFETRFASRARVQTIASGMAGHGWVEPTAAPSQSVTSAPVRALFTSLGVSTGEAFEVEFLNDGDQPLDIGATGLVLEPLGKKAQKAAREEFARAASGKTTSKAKANGYCLEFVREPPPPGMVFRVAPPELQEQFTPMRDIWRSAKQLLDASGLSPDSDPEQYFHSIVQWSMWSKENGFDLRSFGEAFLDRTKKNFAAANQPWTDQAQQAVQQIIPNRWNDIERVLSDAQRLRATIGN